MLNLLHFTFEAWEDGTNPRLQVTNDWFPSPFLACFALSDEYKHIKGNIVFCLTVNIYNSVDVSPILNQCNLKCRIEADLYHVLIHVQHSLPCSVAFIYLKKLFKSNFFQFIFNVLWAASFCVFLITYKVTSCHPQQQGPFQHRTKKNCTANLKCDKNTDTYSNKNE